MKIKEGFLLREIANTHIIVPVAERVIDFKGIMILSGVSPAIVEYMNEHRTREEILEHVLDLYDIDKETAENDLDKFISHMEASGVLEA